MPITCPPGKLTDAQVLQELDEMWVITPEDIKSGWMDVMVKRLFKELSRQLAMVESTKVDKETQQPSPPDLALNAKSLASLQQTMERLARMEAQRDARKAARKVKSDAELRTALQRRYVERAPARRA